MTAFIFLHCFLFFPTFCQDYLLPTPRSPSPLLWPCSPAAWHREQPSRFASLRPNPAGPPDPPLSQHHHPALGHVALLPLQQDTVLFVTSPSALYQNPNLRVAAGSACPGTSLEVWRPAGGAGGCQLEGPGRMAGADPAVDALLCFSPVSPARSSSPRVQLAAWAGLMHQGWVQQSEAAGHATGEAAQLSSCQIRAAKKNPRAGGLWLSVASRGAALPQLIPGNIPVAAVNRAQRAALRRRMLSRRRCRAFPSLPTPGEPAPT